MSIQEKVIDDTKTKEKTKKPNMYNVVLLNDDYTEMDFVVNILQSVFHMSEIEAIAVMMTVHSEGKAVAGTYTYEVAETKAFEVMDLAAKDEFPLMAVVEKQ